MPSGFTSPELSTGCKDVEIVEIYLTSFMSLRQMGVYFDLNRKTIQVILKRNDVQIRPSNIPIINNTKQCSKCSEYKLLDCFYIKKGTPSGRGSRCKSCVSKHQVRYTETEAKWKANNRLKTRMHDLNKRLKNKNNPLFRIKQSVRGAIWRAIDGSLKKKSKTFDVLGYTAEELKIHLEGLFLEGMNWDNYGEWHIDHRRPIASFDFNTDHDIFLAWSLDNIQPLWAGENIRKSSWYNGQKHSYKNKKLNYHEQQG